MEEEEYEYITNYEYNQFIARISNQFTFFAPLWLLLFWSHLWWISYTWPDGCLVKYGGDFIYQASF